LRRRGDPCPLEKPRPYHVIRVSIGLPAGVLGSELPRVLIKITVLRPTDEFAQGKLAPFALAFPLSISGDMFSSLYRLFQAVRAESTVALSGESADEVFGGYPWFHDPKAVDAGTFPWLVTTGNTFDGVQVLDADLLERLNLREFQADSYAQAVAETPVHKGEDAVERRMREVSYLHLTRFVQFSTARTV
jgi:asparagine synthase (glutamine-hydrolysing)